MTEADKFEEHAESWWLTWRDAISDMGLSWPALAWCRDNASLVEALAAGTWQGVPKEPTSSMYDAMKEKTWIGAEYARMGYRAMLAAAPKKPE